MKKEYDTFIESLSDLPEGQEIDLTIRDLTPGPRKYDSRWVKAIVSSHPDQLTDSDILWLRFPKGMVHPQPWAIKILEELEEFKPLPMI
jgi:hypothetical protein